MNYKDVDDMEDVISLDDGVIFINQMDFSALFLCPGLQPNSPKMFPNLFFLTSLENITS